MKNCRRHLTVFWVAIALFGCAFNETKPAPTIASTNTFTARLSSLDSMPAGLTELDVINPTWDSGPVWAVQYSINKNAMFGLYGDDGRLVEWYLDTKNIVFAHELRIASSQAVQFSKDGRILLGSTGAIHKESENASSPVEFLTGIAVWTTETGELEKCLSHPCYEFPLENEEGRTGAVMDSVGKYVFIYDDASVFITDLTGELPSRGSLVNSPDSDYWWRIGHIAYDSSNQRYAIIYQEGRIQMKDINPNQIGPFIVLPALTAEGTKGEFLNIPAALFDPSGNYLAFIRGDQLSVWNVERNSGELFFDDEIPSAFSLLFDRTGELLFVVSKDKIKVFDLLQKGIIVEYTTYGITTLNISEDNRLLFWGDENGAVHLWGVLQTQ